MRFISFRIHHSFSVPSLSLGFRLFYTAANKLNLTCVKSVALVCRMYALKPQKTCKKNTHHVPLVQRVEIIMIGNDQEEGKHDENERSAEIRIDVFNCVHSEIIRFDVNAMYTTTSSTSLHATVITTRATVE